MDDSTKRIAAGIERARREAARKRRAEAVGSWRWLVAFMWGALCAWLVGVYLWGD